MADRAGTRADQGVGGTALQPVTAGHACSSSGRSRVGGVRNRLEFRVEGAGVHSTQITVTSTGATGQWLNRMDPATIEERRRQVDRLADWLDRQ
jgi:hypothetical protein